MKFQHYFQLFLVLAAFSFGPAQSYAFEASCIKTQVERGDDCNDLQVSFDFGNCDAVQSTEVVRSVCVNQKAVAVVKVKEARYIATYASPLHTGEHWRFLTIRKEIRGQPTGMVLEVKKQGIEKENISTKPPAAVVVLPSAPLGPNDANEAVARDEAKALAKVNPPAALPPASVQIGESEAPPKMAQVSSEPAKKLEPVPEVVVATNTGIEKNGKEQEKKETEEESKLQYSGFLDFYYMQDSNNPAPVSQPGNSTPPAGNVKYRAFDIYNDTFNLSLAELTLKKEIGNVGAQVDLGFGNTTFIISPNDAATRNIIQGFGYWKMDDHWKLTAGKTATHISVEGDYAIENFNYSHSLLYTFAIPTWQTGAELDYIAKNWDAGIFTYNGWTGPYQTGQKTAGARLGLYNEAWSFNYTGVIGTQPNTPQGGVRQIHDGNLLWKLKKQAAVALEFVWGYQTSAFAGQDATWSSWILSGKYKWGRYTLAPRLEYYSDPQGYSVNGLSGASNANGPQNLFSATLTNWWEIKEGARVLLEARADNSDQNFFVDSSGHAIGSQVTGTLAFLYEF